MNRPSSRSRRQVAAAVALLLAGAAAAAPTRPNILWIITEDTSVNFSCYGERTIETPNIDRLAREGVRFANAFVTAPVCSTSRSALITGMYQTTIGAQNHQSSRGTAKIYLPQNVRLLPELFKAAGYYVTDEKKTDYNFEWDPSVYAGNDWKKRAPGQPFFAQVQLRGAKLRDNAGGRAEVLAAVKNPVGPGQVHLPPYYPPHPVVLQDWADYLNTVLFTDVEVGRVLEELRREGVADSTYVFFITDHGISHARGKQFLYDEGIHIPMIVRGPGLPAGTVRTDLVEQIDMAAASLALAGIDVPGSMQGRDFFNAASRPRSAVFAARDRCDETVDHIRSVRTRRYKYIRNFLPERPYMQPSSYKDGKPIIQAIRQWQAEHRLDPVQELITAGSRPPEELYDIEKDPWEIRNLAADPLYRGVLLRLRERLALWIVDTRDQGEIPESEEAYDANMKVYVAEKEPARQQQIQKNIELMKTWAAAGK